MKWCIQSQGTCTILNQRGSSNLLHCKVLICRAWKDEMYDWPIHDPHQYLPHYDVQIQSLYQSLTINYLISQLTPPGWRHVGITMLCQLGAVARLWRNAKCRLLTVGHIPRCSLGRRRRQRWARFGWVLAFYEATWLRYGNWRRNSVSARCIPPGAVAEIFRAGNATARQLRLNVTNGDKELREERNGTRLLAVSWH